MSAARQMTMYIIREVTGMSMEAIGQEFQRDHSTVVYSIKTMEENISRDQHLKEMCSDIMKTCVPDFTGVSVTFLKESNQELLIYYHR